MYLILGFLPLSINFILAPVYTSVFGTSEYALLGLAGFFQNFFVVFVGFGLTGAATRFYFDYLKKEKLKKVLFCSIVLLILIASSLIILILLFFGDGLFKLILDNNEFTFSTYGIWVLAYSIATVLNAVFLSYYRNENNLGLYSVVSLSFFIISLSGNLLGVFVFDLGVFGSIAGRAIGAIISTLPFIMLFIYQGRFILRVKWIRKILNYAIPLVPYAFLMMLYEGIDKILVEKIFGLSSLGSYTFAYQVSGISSVFLFAIFNAVSPSIYHELSERKIDYSKITQLTRKLILMMFGFTGFYIAVVGPLIEAFIDQSYHDIIDSLPVLLISYVGRAFYMILSIFLLYYHRNNSLNTITLLSILLGIIVAFLLQDILGVIAIYLSVFIIKNTQAVLSYFFVKKFDDFDVKKLELGDVFLYGLILSFYCLSIPFINSSISFLIPLMTFLLYVIFKRRNIKWTFLH